MSASERRDRWVDDLESEMVICDFVGVLDSGDAHELESFLTSDVIYRPSTSKRVVGSTRVIDMVLDIRRAFSIHRTSLLTVAASDDVVLTEQSLELALAGSTPQRVMSFASYRLVDFRIAAWHQLHA